jgi:hypothetical protein
VNTIYGGSIVGKNGAGNFAGLVIPNVWPGFRNRERKVRGETRAAAGATCFISPVGADPSWLNDPGLPLVGRAGRSTLSNMSVPAVPC